MSRFQIEDIGKVFMTVEYGVVEYAATEKATGIVHWLSQAEYDDVLDRVKKRLPGQFKNRAEDELAQVKAELAAKDEEIAQAQKDRDQSAQKVTELQGLVSDAAQVISAQSLRLTLKDAKRELDANPESVEA